MDQYDDDLVIGERLPDDQKLDPPKDYIPLTERFVSFFHQKASHILAIVNQKGGCGKTTTAINLAASLAHGGYKVLLVDTDPQAQATLGLGVDVDPLESSLYEVMIHREDFQNIVQLTKQDNLFVAPAQSNLSGAQLELASVVGRESILKSALDSYLAEYPFDFVIIDCSPTLNLVTINALTASHSVVIPIQTHYFSLEGMRELFRTIDTVKERTNPTLKILGIAITLFDKRLKVNHEMCKQINDYFDDLVFSRKIRLNVKLMESPMYKKPIVMYAPSSAGNEDYQALAREVVMRCHSVFQSSHKLIQQKISNP